MRITHVQMRNQGQTFRLKKKNAAWLIKEADIKMAQWAVTWLIVRDSRRLYPCHSFWSLLSSEHSDQTTYFSPLYSHSRKYQPWPHCHHVKCPLKKCTWTTDQTRPKHPKTWIYLYILHCWQSWFQTDISYATPNVFFWGLSSMVLFVFGNNTLSYI